LNVQVFIDHPVATLLLLLGVAAVIIAVSYLCKAVGVSDITPIAFRSIRFILKTLHGEFTKTRTERTAIEQIDFILVAFLGVAFLLSTLLVLLPSALAQLCGFSVGSSSAMWLLVWLALFLILAATGSAFFVYISNKEQRIHAILAKHETPNPLSRPHSARPNSEASGLD
jgi:hypothetical protein